MEIKALKELGLTNAEAKIYNTLLEIGSSKTGILIEKTKLQSSTIYHSLGSLIEKGIVSFILEGKIKIYSAENPERLLEIHEKKRQEFLKILPMLKEKQIQSKSKQTAKIYKGIKGLQTAYNDILETMKKGEEYYFFQMHQEDLLKEELLTFFRNYHLKRSEKRINVKGIITNDSNKKSKEIFSELKHTQIKYVNEFLPTGLVIYKNKIIIIEWENSPITIMIESKSLSNSYRKFFLDKWNKLK